MKNRVKIGIRILAFLVIFLYLLIHISYMLRGELSHTRNNLSGYYDMEKNTLDVVFVGTSGTFSAFAPMDAYEKYGFTSYNFATNVMGVDNIPYALDELMKTQSPKLVVIDIYPFINYCTVKGNSEQAVRYNVDGYKYSFNRFCAINKLVENDDKLSYYFDIIKYHENEFNWRNFFGSYHYVNKGYNSLGYGPVESAVLTDRIIELDNEGDSNLTAILKKCEQIKSKCNTQFLFIYYPYGDIYKCYEHLNKGIGTNAIEKVNYIETRVLDYQFEFLNCQRIKEQFELDNNVDYWDAAHFNIYGTEKVTQVVGAYLKEKYDLPDKREDAGYTTWASDLKEWHQNKESYKKTIDDLIKQYNEDLQ